MPEENVAVEPQVPGLESLSEKERHDWRMTGELPKAEAAKEPAQSDEKDGKDASAVAEPAADKGTEAPKGEDKRTQRPPGRLSYQELREQLRARDEELAKLRAPKEPPAAKEEPKTEKREKLRARPTPYDEKGQPKPEYKTWQDYEDDLLAWNRESTIHELEERQSKAAREASVAQQNKAIEESWKARVEEARKKHADFDEALEAIPQFIAKGSIVDSWLMNSEHGAELAYYLHKNREALKTFENITPLGAYRELSRLEGLVSAPSNAAPPPKVTKAPPPVSEVGGRASAPADDVAAAVNDGNYAAYAKRQNQREMQHLRK